MTIDEFDKKYAAYLEFGFDGMEFEDKEIVDLVDRYFTEYIKIPGFSFSQVKNKFGEAHVYLENADGTELEKEIDKILIRNKYV
jgi:hypothetical protein